MNPLTDAKPAFCWTETYRVNVATLDREHQRLFDTINELNTALAEGRGSAALEHVLRQLLEYAQTHFASEEVLMDAHGFPGLPSHRLEHGAFSRRVAKYLDDYRAGKVGTPASLMLFLQSWLREHILKCDKAYSAFLNERGVF